MRIMFLLKIEKVTGKAKVKTKLGRTNLLVPVVH